MILCDELAIFIAPSLFVIALTNTVKRNLDLAYRNFLIALKDDTHDVFGLRIERADPLDVRQVLINADAGNVGKNIPFLLLSRWFPENVVHEDISVHEVGILDFPLL